MGYWTQVTLSLASLSMLSACTKAPAHEHAPASKLCRPAHSWDGTRQAFREATSAWGLDGIEGVRFNVVDIDRDGWPDVVVRRGNMAADGHNDQRSTWVLRNTGSGRFEDITAKSRLLQRRHAALVTGRPVRVLVFGDINNDGYADAFLGVADDDITRDHPETTSELLLGGPDGFRLGGTQLPFRHERPASPAGAVFTDYDRDGKLDLWVTHHNVGDDLIQDRLYKGNGRGGFRDVTESSGLVTQPWTDNAALNQGRSHSRAWAATACDLNDDGIPELLAPAYGRSPNHLWQGERKPDGRVRYHSQGVASGYAYDDKRDWTDNLFARCYCQANRDAEDCHAVPPPIVPCRFDNWLHANDRQPYRLGGNSAFAQCADIDNDGKLDLLTGEIRHWWAGDNSDESQILHNTTALHRNLRNITFARMDDSAAGLAIAHPQVTPEAARHPDYTGWNEGHMSGAAFDFDNDGKLDIYLGNSDYPGTRGHLYRQTHKLSFIEVPPALGIDNNRSHGVAIADFDRDGDLDVIVGHNATMRCRRSTSHDCYPTAQIRYFENLVGNRNHWLQLRLEGTGGSNRSALGARIRVTTEDGVVQTHEVAGSYSQHGGQQDHTAHFGLGTACAAEVDIVWPDRMRTQSRFQVEANRRHDLRQPR